jgi:PKD repeat protein
MRSIRLLAAVFSIIALGSACGDGAGTPPPDNEAPVAGFNEVCTSLSCVFTDASTDPDGNTTITTRNWSFGDGTSTGERNPTYAYTTAGTKTVALTVTDNAGATNTFSKNITVSAANQAPIAGFTVEATNNSVAFTNTSIDPDGTITYLWNFGEPISGANNETTVEAPTHAYTVTAAATFTVTLTVTDNVGATDVETQTVTVSPAPNTPPTAGFTHICNAANCTFTSSSTDVAPGAITSYAWTFGDFGTANVMSPLHTYAITAPTDFTVTLTVTDNQGAKDVETQTVTVIPPPPGAEGCFTSGTRVECALNITARSTVKLKLLAINCDLRKQRVTIPPPIGDQSFLAVCSRTAGQELGIFGGPLDEAIVFEAGTQVRIRFDQGIADADNPVLGPPAANFVGTFPNWTINFEDGANPGAEGEPDFIDVVLGVRAILLP